MKKGKVDTKNYSRGVAFVEFTEHQHALVALRVLNNNPGSVFQNKFFLYMLTGGHFNICIFCYISAWFTILFEDAGAMLESFYRNAGILLHLIFKMFSGNL